jgi:hypothetical protein
MTSATSNTKDCDHEESAPFSATRETRTNGTGSIGGMDATVSHTLAVSPSRDYKNGTTNDTILMSTPHNGPNKPPEVIDYLSHHEAKNLRLPSSLLSSFDDPTDGRFYCLATKASGQMQGSFIGLMKPDSVCLPPVTVRRHGSDLGMRFDPPLEEFDLFLSSL